MLQNGQIHFENSLIIFQKQSPGAATLLKKRLRRFPVNFAEFPRTPPVPASDFL